jgi:UDP-N-acetyl-D-galactosamine dehydrogenase
MRARLELTSERAGLRHADFFIVTNRPDLSAMFEASRMVGTVLKRGDIVVYESTVYPGAVEEDCVPILERASGLNAGADFDVGYSPERINPGDRKHRFATNTKVVSAQNARTLDIIADVYGSVVTSGIHRAPSIKVAEAAKVIENTQRDLNIAFMNELSLIFQSLGIDTGDVLAAAGTKWNFLPFQPGLVGGHCIPYYLTYRAEQAGYHPEVILARRRINDGMGQQIARKCIRCLPRRKGRAGVVTVLGMTFKENVPDIRNSRVIDMVRELQSFGVKVQIADPLADSHAVEEEYGIALSDIDTLEPADALILAVAHDAYVEGGWRRVQRLLDEGEGLILDVKMKLDRGAKPSGVELWRL